MGRTSIDAFVTVKDLLQTVDSPDSLNFSSSAVSYLMTMMGLGYALGVNVGTMWKVPLGLRSPTLTLAATVEDLGWTTFTSYGSYPTLAKLPQKTHLGTHLQYVFGSGKTEQKVNLLMDYRDCFNNTPLYQRLHLGAEYKNKAISLRTGLHQGYWTAGVSVEFPPHTRVHLSSFAVELGDAQWVRAHRWYLLEVILGFNPL